jgi:O-antigen ligase
MSQVTAPSKLVVVGLAIFTIVVIAARLGGAEAGIIVALVGLSMRPQQLHFPAPFWWAMALVAWAFVTSYTALAPEVAQATAVNRLKVFVVFLVVVNTLRAERLLRLYIFLILACFMLSPARGALVNYFSGYTLFGRALWNQIYANPNDLAAMCLLALGLALAVFFNTQERRVVRWCCAASAFLLVTIIFLTQSRGVFIGMCLGMGPPLIGLMWKRPKVIAGVLALAVVGALFIPDAVWTRLSGIGKLTSTSTIAQADPEGSANQRWEIQKTAYKIFTDYPVVGVGLGCYPLANNLYSPKLGARDTHNTYLNLAAELGLPGLLLWLALVASVFRYWRRAKSTLALTTDDKPGVSTQGVWIERAIVGFLLAGFFGTYSGITMLYLLLGILWCSASLVQHAASPLRTR